MRHGCGKPHFSCSVAIQNEVFDDQVGTTGSCPRTGWELRGCERGIVKRLQGQNLRALRRDKVRALREDFERLTQALFVHPDGDFLLWQLRASLAEFEDAHVPAGKRGVNVV